MPFKDIKRRREYQRQKKREYRRREAARTRAIDRALGLDEVRKAIRRDQKDLFDIIYPKRGRVRRRR